MAAFTLAAPTATSAADAANVITQWWPTPAQVPRVVIPPPSGTISRARATLVISHLINELDVDSPGNVTDATGAVATAALDGFLMHLGHSGANYAAGDTSDRLEWNDAAGAFTETALARLYGVFRHDEVTPRQFAATFAPRLSALALEFGVLYRWGAQRGCLFENRRISHPVAEFLPDLSGSEAKIVATLGAAALQAAPAKALLRDTVANVIHSPAPPVEDPLAHLRGRLAALSQ